MEATSKDYIFFISLTFMQLNTSEHYFIHELSRNSLPSGKSVRVLGILKSVDQNQNKCVIEYNNATLFVDTSTLENSPLLVNSLYQVIGEVEVVEVKK